MTAKNVKLPGHSDGRTRTKILVLAAACCLLGFGTPVNAASDEDIDAMTSNAVFLGRAIACGLDTDLLASKIGKWLDRVFPPGSSDPASLSLHHSSAQREGRQRHNLAEHPMAMERLFVWTF